MRNGLDPLPAELNCLVVLQFLHIVTAQIACTALLIFMNPPVVKFAGGPAWQRKWDSQIRSLFTFQRRYMYEFLAVWWMLLSIMWLAARLVVTSFP